MQHIANRFTFLPFRFLLFFLFNLSSIKGQTNCMQNGEIMPAYFNIAVVLAQSYVNQYPNEAQARAVAETQVNAGIKVLQDLITANGYQLTLNLFFISDFKPVATTAQGPEAYIIDVRNEFNNHFKCVDQDGLIILRQGSGHGFGSNGLGGVLLGGGVLQNPNRAAHEIGHLIGLLHCCTDCACPPSVMCDYNTQGFFIASCEKAAMNTEVMVPTNCSRWMDFQNPLPYDFECPTVVLPGIAIATDQPNLLEASKGCTPDRSMSMYSVTVNGGQNGISNASLKIRYQNQVYDFDPLTMGLGDFNNDVGVSGNSFYNEISNISGGNIQTFSLNPYENITFHFKILYNPIAAVYPPNTGQAQVEARLSYGTSNLITKHSDPQVIRTISGTVAGFSSADSPVFVDGAVILGGGINPNIAINPRLVLVSSGGSLKVDNGVNLSIGDYAYTVFEGCTNMWQGITMGTSSTITARNATFKDAQKAISVRNGTTLKVVDCRFINNNYGIFTSSGGAGAYDITLTGNEYGTVGALKPSYSGQSPAPNLKGFAGIYVKNVNMANPLGIVANPLTGSGNQFYNLKYGIIADNSTITVQNTDFANITSVAKGSGYAQGPNGTGRAIYASNNSIVKVDGLDILAPKVTYYNCEYGIESTNSRLIAWSTKMDQMRTGISVLDAVNLLVSIADNNIRAENYGIKINNVKGIAIGVDNNTINNIVTGSSPKAIGIQISNCSVNNIQFNAVLRNKVAIAEGNLGIDSRDNTNLTLYDNDVNMTNSSTIKNTAIHLEGGNGNLLSCNRVDGTGLISGTNGISAMHTDRSAFVCNNTQSTGFGLRFEGVLFGEAPADIATNTMENNGVGLYYGSGANTGPQLHRGNKWEGTGTQAQHSSVLAVAVQSSYAVDATENSLFYPNLPTPIGWFSDLDNPIPTTTCPVNFGCTLLKPTPEVDMDRKIARGELLADYYTAAANWLAQRRLYGRFLAEGNPYLSSDTDFRNFLSAAALSGLANYADVQVSIQHLFDIRQMDADSLRIWGDSMQARIDQIIKLDGQLAQPTLYTTDRNTYTTARSAKITALTNLNITYTNKITTLESNRLSAISGIVTKNNALTGSSYYQQYEQVVNDIFLQTVASNVYSFTTTQYNLLDSIARQCPLSRGEAVLRARALLSLVQEVPVNYDNESACLPANRDNQVPVANGLHIYPNPVSDILNIEYAADDPAVLEFFNAIGQKVLGVQLSGRQLRQLDVSTLQSGIYWYSLHTNNIPNITGKVLIAN